MFAAAMRNIPSAADSRSRPSGLATRCSITCRAASACTGMRPFSSATGFSRCKAISASVMVGSWPPRP
ncbi:hypothetical protein G6F50_018636 [Rhizopus delemar]|uniref:Uncharacterized protein n=1 Tax=Rhizopus delemar TaxID=936053 RepID=A0A9P6XMJ1_9FUNG|nr:hypothetical protein G6F50_018636 [Rhizopus delemar]